MSFLTAAFFSWVQGAPFYVDVHSEAVSLLPPGSGRTWIDVGCGPGLVARLACERGYDVLGIDRDPAMIRLARCNTLGNQGCRFEVGDLDHASGQYLADVVSAASLLFVVPDRVQAIKQLWDCVRPGGRLLVIETTEQMTPEVSRKVRSTTQPGRRLVLTMWARARRGKAISAEVFRALPAQSTQCTPLLNGLVHAWRFAKGPA